MTEEIEQFEHFFNAGDRVVLIHDKQRGESKFKKMSYNDVLIKSVVYRVVSVIDKNRFKIRMITK
jgi:hypothetical protein